MTPRKLVTALLVAGVCVFALSAMLSRPGTAATDIGILVDGKEHRLSSLKGKVVLLDFWATWCGPCRMSMPGIQQLYTEKRDKGFEVLGVAIERDSNAPVRQVLEALGVTYPAGFPVSKQEVEAYNPSGLPTMVLVDRGGRIRWRQEGYSQQLEQELRALVEELL
jgi:thiol-disulfide isomerase/thioredoxin